jgi:hypothetical protein
LAAVAALGVASVGRAGVIPATTSALTVNQTVTPAGAGQWDYTFSFTNTDTAPIWHFLVYSPFATTNGAATGLPGVSAGVPLNIAGTPYDARNIDPLLTHLSNMYSVTFGSNGVPVGADASISFRASVYQPTPFLYAYEINGNYAGGGVGPEGSLGRVHATGLTGVRPQAVPEPLSLTLFGGLLAVGGVAVRRRMRAA